MEEWKSACEEGQENHARAPHVDRGVLLRAFQQHFWGTETTGARSICSAAAAGVVFGVASCLVAGLLVLHVHAVGHLIPAFFQGLRTNTVVPVGTFTLGEAEIYEDTTGELGVI